MAGVLSLAWRLRYWGYSFHATPATRAPSETVPVGCRDGGSVVLFSRFYRGCKVKALHDSCIGTIHGDRRFKNKIGSAKNRNTGAVVFIAHRSDS
ncbi:MAG TPA: hypothetical protein VN039_15785 [Nitrospira sp.]|nr:hypothetical protein [Nitrospira sp.]